MGNSALTGISSGKRRPVTDKATERDDDGAKLQCAVSGMRGWRPTMEDQHIMQLQLSEELQDHCLFAIFDGHGGGLTSAFLEKKLVQHLMKQPQMKKYAALKKKGVKSRSDVSGIQLLKQALSQSFRLLDVELRKLQEKVTATMAVRHEERKRKAAACDTNDSDSPVPDFAPVERSGSTAIVVLLTPTHIITANVGDSRAILRRNGKTLPLSFDHKPNDLPERRRIVKAGGFVKNKRVDGDLAVSRAFGDFSYKGANAEKVIATPDFIVCPRDYAGDEFIILACDGIWDVASNVECSNYVQSMLSHGIADLGYICEDALDLCLGRNSRDNMTMMIVSMPAMKVNHSSRASLQNALWQAKRQLTTMDSTFRRVQGVCEAATRDVAIKLHEVTTPLIRAY